MSSMWETHRAPNSSATPFRVWWCGEPAAWSRTAKVSPADGVVGVWGIGERRGWRNGGEWRRVGVEVGVEEDGEGLACKWVWRRE